MKKYDYAIEVLKRAATANEKNAKALRDAIEWLEGCSSCEMNSDIGSIIDRQKIAVKDDEAYPAEMFKGMQRIEIAIQVAKDFEGVISVVALRNVLKKPGVLRSVKQVNSVSSRVLAGSDQFERIWEGIYRLKVEETGIEPAP